MRLPRKGDSPRNDPSMKSAIAAALLAVTAFSSDAQELRVLTYNIHHAEGTDGKLDVDRIVRVIRAAAPDVVCLQEVDRGLPRTQGLNLPRLFAEKLGMTAVFDANYRFDGGEYGNATFTRLPIVRHENIGLPNPNQKEPRGCLRTVIKLGDREIDILNTHLGLEGEERRQQAEAIRQALRPVPAVLAGDLNENENAPGVRRLLEVLGDPAEGASQSLFTASAAKPRRRIDFILASKEFSPLSTQVIATPDTPVASDHLPFLAVLKLGAD